MNFNLIYYQCATKCNLHCPYCYDWKNKSEELSPEEIRKYFKFKTKVLCVTGGEMCLKKDIIEVVDALLETADIKKLILCSNFLFPHTLEEIAEHNLDLLKKLQSVEFSGSLDGLKETHNKIRNGSFDRVINTIHVLKNMRKKLPNSSVGINMCIFPANYHEIVNVFDLAKGLNVKFTCCFPHPLERIDMIWNDEIYNSIEHQLKQIGLFDPIQFEIFKHRKRGESCGAGKNWCVIHPNGDVLPCWNPQPALNIRTSKISDIIKNIRSFDSEDCVKCDRYDNKY